MIILLFQGQLFCEFFRHKVVRNLTEEQITNLGISPTVDNV